MQGSFIPARIYKLNTIGLSGKFIRTVWRLLSRITCQSYSISAMNKQNLCRMAGTQVEIDADFVFPTFSESLSWSDDLMKICRGFSHVTQY